MTKCSLSEIAICVWLEWGTQNPTLLSNPACACSRSSTIMRAGGGGGQDVPSPPEDELVSCTLEFLEVAVHTVLWSRSLYPAELFERVKYCGFNARRSRHPGLNEYIGSVLAGLKVRWAACDVGHHMRAWCWQAGMCRKTGAVLLHGAVDLMCICRLTDPMAFYHQAPLKARALQEVALVFFDPSGRPLERVTFDIKVADPSCCLQAQCTAAFQCGNQFDVLSRLLVLLHGAVQLEDEASDGARATPDVAAVEAGFTSALLILSCADSFSTPLPAGRTCLHQHTQQPVLRPASFQSSHAHQSRRWCADRMGLLRVLHILVCLYEKPTCSWQCTPCDPCFQVVRLRFSPTAPSGIAWTSTSSMRTALREQS